MPYKLFVEGTPTGRSVECDTIEELVAALKAIEAVGVSVAGREPVNTKKAEANEKRRQAQARSWAEAEEYFNTNPGKFDSVDAARKDLAKRKKLKKAEELLRKSPSTKKTRRK